MFLIDTHTHLYLDAFAEDREAMIQRALDAGVQRMLLPNIDERSIDGMHAMSERWPNHVFPMMGLHPCDVKEDYMQVLQRMKAHFTQRSYVAVGETGIDLYWDKTSLHNQIESFKIQIEWAKEYRLPIVIHARDSFDEITEVVDEMHDERLRGVFHCFTGTSDQAKKVMSYGSFMLGIGGVLTYPKANLGATLATVPLEFIVLETDSPFLTPVPFRGKRNESSYIPFVLRQLSTAMGIEEERLADITTSNALRMFDLVPKPTLS